MKVYLAARYARREELLIYKHHLELGGATVTATWLGGKHSADDAAPQPGQSAQWAYQDLEDLDKADTLVCFTEASDSIFARGGRHVEAGYWIAKMRKGEKFDTRRMFVCGPNENIFYELPFIVQHDTWPETLAAVLSIK